MESNTTWLYRLTKIPWNGFDVLEQAQDKGWNRVKMSHVEREHFEDYFQYDVQVYVQNRRTKRSLAKAPSFYCRSFSCLVQKRGAALEFARANGIEVKLSSIMIRSDGSVEDADFDSSSKRIMEHNRRN